MTEANDWTDDEPLDPALQERLAALPREADPSPLLEARTMRALRERGWLTGRRRLPAGWWAAGVAASIALFASGLVTGQWLGARQAAVVLAAQQRASLEEMTTLLERTGGAYVNALARLAESDVHQEDGSDRAREVALQILHQAANEVVRLAPNEPVAVKILQGFEHAALEKRSPAESRTRRRQIIWF